MWTPTVQHAWQVLLADISAFDSAVWALVGAVCCLYAAFGLLRWLSKMTIAVHHSIQRASLCCSINRSPTAPFYRIINVIKPQNVSNEVCSQRRQIEGEKQAINTPPNQRWWSIVSSFWFWNKSFNLGDHSMINLESYFCGYFFLFHFHFIFLC